MAAGAVVSSLLSACATNALRRIPVNVAPVPATAVDYTVLLIGDAGSGLPGHRLFRELTRQASERPDRTVVVFLGDNLYPNGLPDSAAADRRRAVRRLDAQVAVARESGAQTIFLPGNHDWGGDGPPALERLRRMERFVEERGDGLVRMLPDRGCPGPATADFGDRVRVVVLDTQWWLQQSGRPEHPTSACPNDSEEEILAALERTLAESPARRTFVVGHHPLESTGPHGGYYGWRDHLFPLRRLASWLYIPLPGIGSLYPLYRRMNPPTQDLGSREYRHLRESLDSVFAISRPLMYAAGHEHTLQLIESAGARYVVVSGAGPNTGIHPTGWSENTYYAQGVPGFARVDVQRNGATRVAFIAMRSSGAVETYSRMIADSFTAEAQRR